MQQPPEDIRICLLFILHRGFVETRLLAGAGKNDQVFDLADALELIPGMLKHWRYENYDLIRDLLEVYQSKYPIGGFDFLARLKNRSSLDF